MEDEVDKRAREIANTRQAAAREAAALATRTAQRMAALENATADLLDEIATAASDRTSYTIFVEEDRIECEITELDGTRRQALLFIDAYGHPEDINAATWEIVFNCEAWDRAEGELTEVFGWSHDRAVSFGIDAVLDGLAVLVHDGHRVVSASRQRLEELSDDADEPDIHGGLQPEPSKARPLTAGERFRRVITSGWIWLTAAYVTAAYLAYMLLPKTG